MRGGFVALDGSPPEHTIARMMRCLNGRRRITSALLPLAGFVLAGCSGLGNFVVPAHPLSSHRTKGRPTLAFLQDPPGSATRAFVPSVSQLESAVGYVVRGVERAIESESKRYRATYSARVSGNLCRATEGSPPSPTTCWLHFERPSEVGEASFSFVARLECTVGGDALRVIPESARFRRSKSKVAAPSFRSLWPNYWLASVVLLPWSWFDRDLTRVDTSVRITLEAVVRGRNALVGAVDLPLGKIDLSEVSDDGRKFSPSELKGLASPYLALPTRGDGKGLSSLPLNVTVTVTESNDLGDVIGRAATRLAERRDDLSERLLQLLPARE